MLSKIFTLISKLLPLSFFCCAIVSLLDLILLPNSLRYKLITVMLFFLFAGLTLLFLWLEKQFKRLEQAAYLKTPHLKALNRLRLFFLVGSFFLSAVFFGLLYGMANRIFNGIPLFG